MNKTNLKRIADLRKKRGILQLRVATELEVSQELISKLEQGKTNGSIDVLVKLADFFYTSTDYILGRTDFEGSIDMVTNKLSEKEVELLSLYKKLSNKNKDIVNAFILGMINKEED